MNPTDPAETAWKIHQAVSEWTGRVDAKASFALAVESAILAAIVAASGEGRRFDGLYGSWLSIPFWIGLVLIALSVVAAMSVVSPRLRAAQVEAESTQNFIYFGHLNYWSATDLTDHLRTADPLPVLARQVVVMSQIAWRKHRRVQQSLCLAAAGASIVALVGVLV